MDEPRRAMGEYALGAWMVIDSNRWLAVRSHGGTP